MTTWVGQDFTASAMDVKWLTDITEHPTGEGTFYLCAVKEHRMARSCTRTEPSQDTSAEFSL
jgi:hypothetical protein